MEPLKLIALDEEDLAVLSSLLQDAVLRVADMTYLPKQRRFAAALNRFEWEKTGKEAGKPYLRRRTALRFDRVFGAKLKNVKLGRRLDPARSRMHRGRTQRSRPRMAHAVQAPASRR
jgi:hypothetical protein